MSSGKRMESNKTKQYIRMTILATLYFQCWGTTSVKCLEILKWLKERRPSSIAPRLVETLRLKSSGWKMGSIFKTLKTTTILPHSHREDRSEAATTTKGPRSGHYITQCKSGCFFATGSQKSRGKGCVRVKCQVLEWTSLLSSELMGLQLEARLLCRMLL